MSSLAYNFTDFTPFDKAPQLLQGYHLGESCAYSWRDSGGIYVISPTLSILSQFQGVPRARHTFLHDHQSV